MKNVLEKYGRVLESIDIKDHSTFKVSALIDYLVLPNTIEDLKALIHYLKKENVKYKIIGKCSNLIFVNEHYEGVLIRLDFLNHFEIKDNLIKAGSGVSLMKLAVDASSSCLTGLEWATGIPGSVGGAIVQNAGAYGTCMSDVVESVTVLTDGNIEIWNKEKLDFAYRHSYLKDHPEIICLEVTLKLEEGNSKEIMESIKTKREKRFATQPLEYPSCGSIFRNPEGALAAGKLIEDAGLKGLTVGGAEVSEKHANFIINKGGATGKDIKELISKIKTELKKKYNIELEEEQEYVE